MALISPGVQVTVIDESQYIPSAVNTVPYFVIATAQNKVSGAGVGVAAGTLKANANKTYLITSQRDLTATFGVPFFYNTTTGTPINGYELNEYGLLAAYSALGISNRAYVQRVDIDLTELTASLSRPTGAPNDGTYWLDTSTTAWGIQEWSSVTNSFTVKTPLVINSSTQVDGNNVPLNTVGTIGDYAVVTTTVKNIGYYKNSNNNWVAVGSDDWKMSWPTVTGTNAPGSLTPTTSIYINGTPVTVSTVPTVQGFAEQINNAMIPGIVAAATSGNRLALYADSNATVDGSTIVGGIINIEPGTGGAALLTALGIAAGQYLAPTYLAGYSYSAPRWGSTQANPRPTGSVWNNMSAANNGLSLKVKKYSTTVGTWVAQTTNAYADFASALYGLDPSGGGKNIAVGATVALWGANDLGTTPNSSQALEIFEKVAFGATVVTGTTTPTGNAFPPLPGPALQSFTISASQPGTTTMTTGTAAIASPGTISDFVAAVSAAGVPNVSASVDSAGHIVFTHSAGGVINLTNLVGTPLTTAGFTAGTPLVTPSSSSSGTLQLCNFTSSPLFTYTASSVAPDQNPANGRLWYYSSIDDVDVMIQNNGSWVGYQNVSNDVRGYNLTLTNAAGPIVAATAPTTQTDVAQSPLQYGDLWIDSSDLENYPMMYRWQQVDGQDQWVSVDTADQVTQNGILFADARWAPNGSTDPISDPIPSIVSLLTSNYLDLDAPDASLYPEGMLLWNTRRSGYNVKSFATDYFTSANFPDAGSYPTVTSTWRTASGNKVNGAMYAGRLAQREMVVKAMKAGLDTSLGAREDTAQFTLIATPGYPEMIPNMVALSNERNNTVFVIGDTPMRLPGNGTDLVNWANNNGGVGLPTGDGLASSSQYLGVFYPSATTNDLSGNTVVVPPSHMMVRTIIRSDEVAYPWLAPAGTRRGVVDNATQLGYIDAATGEFVPLSVNQALRDVLYTNAVNPITFVPGIGITNFGNKTATIITSAMDRINVARLVAFLRGRLEEIGKLYLFEPNDQITRSEITNTCNSLMVDLVAKRAIYDYLVVCDLSNNTPARIDRNELWVDIAIEPVKAVEFIYIPLRIKNTGEIAAGQ